MLKTYLTLMSLLLVSVYSQEKPDPSFCDANQLPEAPEKLPFPNYPDGSSFRGHFEKNSDKNKFTEQISEIFDGQNNIAVSITTFEGQTVKSYSYGDTNELLLVLGKNCQTKVLDESYEATEFFVVPDGGIDSGKEKILTFFGMLSYLYQSGLKVVYTGSSSNGQVEAVRGIPTLEWQTCIFDLKSSSTVKLTISFSDPKKWVSAFNVPGYESIPLQIKAEYKKKADGQRINEIISVNRFKPRKNNVTRIDENLFTDTGVYCPDRKNTKPLPIIPSVFTVWTQEAVPNLDSNSMSGQMSTIRNQYDFNKKLSRIDYFEKNKRLTQIHDYNSGLSYSIDRESDTCEVRAFTGEDAQTASDFFTFNQQPEFQYVGMKIVRGINTDVWIAKRKYEGNDATYEWYFSTNGWITQETGGIESNEPVLLIITKDVPVEGSIFPKKQEVHRHMLDFDEKSLDLFDPVLKACQKNGLNKHLRFLITSDKFDIMKLNQGAVRESLLNSITAVAKVGFFRVIALETVYDKGFVVVTFTLLDKPLFYGPGVKPDENDLDTAYLNLKNSINNKAFTATFNDTFKYSGAITIQADSNSLLDLTSRDDGRFQYIDTNTEETIGYTSGSVFGFVIGFLIIGLLIGFVAGIFLILKRSEPIALPGALSFFNPNYKAPTSSNA